MGNRNDQWSLATASDGSGSDSFQGKVMQLITLAHIAELLGGLCSENQLLTTDKVPVDSAVWLMNDAVPVSSRETALF